MILVTYVYGDVREGKVYYQVAFMACTTLNCYLRTTGTGWSDFGEPSTYHDGYAECPGLSMKLITDEIKLEVKSAGVIVQTYLTDQTTAISKGPYPNAGNIHKTRAGFQKIPRMNLHL